MNETGNQTKGRVIGMDIHPTVFSACALENTDVKTANRSYFSIAVCYKTHHKLLHKFSGWSAEMSKIKSV